MSKLSQLKQDAYQAGKKRDWETAVSIYERILDLDKSNPTLVNELGDLCLKAGKVRPAVNHFLNAASKYSTNGLLNNAVAIYKKILRHDSNNLHAHWYLAKTRASQGLLADGEEHGILFLENSNNITGDIKEIFLKRCVLLFELYSDSTPIMEQLLQVFRMWEMHLESARVNCILACQIWDSGDEERAKESMQNVVSQTPDIVKYPEHSQWQQRSKPSQGGSVVEYSDVNSLDLGGNGDPAGTVEPEILAEPVVPFVEKAPTLDSIETSEDFPDETNAEPWGGVSFDSPEKVTKETPVAGIEIPEDCPSGEFEIESDSSFSGFEIEDGQSNNASMSHEIPEVDGDGCFSIDDDSDLSFDDLISNATAGVPDMGGDQITDFADPFADAQADDPANDDLPNQSAQPVDLLAQILAEDSDSVVPGESNQVATIAEEIGAKVGAGGEGDEESLYEMGLVYLEMDMHDQACESFEKAAGHPDYAVRAHEMWGITLLRSGKIDEAVVILTAGLDLPEEGSRQQLGMLYHLGRAQEEAGRMQEAEHCYGQIHALDRKFLDVGKRLANLAKV